MKKLITYLSIPAIGVMGTLGLIGFGATSASAAVPNPVHVAVCLSANTQEAALTTALATANTAAGLALTAFNNASSAESAALGNYASDIATVITDSDTASLNLVADTITFQAADTNFVSSVVTWANTRAANITAQNAVGLVQIQKDVIDALISSVGCGA